MSSLFTAGAPLVSDPAGDPMRQAIASLRGYAYQIYVSALAWLVLKEGEELWLEVAEDYAVTAGEALKAVQVKDTQASGTVTLRSQGVRDAIDAFVDLTERNTDRKVSLRFLSTSQIGREQKSSDRPGGISGLLYWRKVASGAEMSPLRKVLLSPDNISSKVKAFIDERDDEVLRNDLIRRIHWDCGQGDINEVREELENGVIRIASAQLKVPTDEARRLVSAVLDHVFKIMIKQSNRCLEFGDLCKLLDAETRVSLPRNDLEMLIAALASKASGSSSSITLSVPNFIRNEGETQIGMFVSQRRAILNEVELQLRQQGALVITGGTGIGKTTIARLAAQQFGGAWLIADLRNAPPRESAERLSQIIHHAPKEDTRGIILDDLEGTEAPEVEIALGRLMNSLRRRDQACIVTSYRTPTVRVLTSILMVDSTAVVALPYLTKEEISEVIDAAGGDGAFWADAVYIATFLGHPQLVQALIFGLRSRSWPVAERRSMLLAPGSNPDAGAERAGVRRRLLDALPNENTRNLLYRVSLIWGPFSRSLALAVAATSPNLSQPGERFESLIGPWIDLLGGDQHRISPLVSKVGAELLDATEQMAVHRAVSEAIMGMRSINVAQADLAFVHGVAGKSDACLLKLAGALISIEREFLPVVADWMPILRFQRLDQPIYPKNRAISGLLRLAQMHVVAAARDDATSKRCAEVLLRETAAEPNKAAREHLEYMVLGKLLVLNQLAGLLPNWFELILRFDQLTRAINEFDALVENFKNKHENGPTVIGILFVTQVLGLRSVRDLVLLFEKLDKITPDYRRKFLDDGLHMPSDFALLVNNPWLKEQASGSINWLEAAESYKKISAQASAWGYRGLALRCHVARGVMFDEYGKEPDAAIAALDEAAAIFGPEPVLARARGKILYRRKDHAGALGLLRDAVDKVAHDDPIERAFMFREAAICAAETGDWAVAKSWFTSARNAAEIAQSDDMKVMAIGLRADTAIAEIQSGNQGAGLSELAVALEEIGKIDPDQSLRAAYCHRVIRHSVLWCLQTLSGRVYQVEDKPAAMVPGSCSNPDPPEAIRTLKLAPYDITWYLLAQADACVGSPIGIAEMIGRYTADRSYPSMEVMLRHEQLCSAIHRGDASAFAGAFYPWLASQFYCNQNPELLKAHDLFNPLAANIPHLTKAELASVSVTFIANDAILAFAHVAALTKNTTSLPTLNSALQAVAGRDYACRKTLDDIIEPDERRLPSPDGIAAEIYLVSTGSTDEPEGLFRACVRFTEWMANSNFRSFLEGRFSNWVTNRWEITLKDQRFLLLNPNTSCIQISDALRGASNDLISVARIILAAQTAIRIKLADEMKARIAQIAGMK